MSAILRRFAPQEEKPMISKALNHKPLILANKGISHDIAQILDDFLKLVPHAKKESRTSEKDFYSLDETATDLHCDTIALFQTKHHEDPFLWISKSPEGPSMCLFIEESKSIEQLSSVGNCMKGSRPLLIFDPLFESTDIFSMTKDLFLRLFSVPFQDPHSKPFVDRTMTFNIINNKIIIHNFQIQWEDTPTLVEIGPRLTLIPAFILAGVFKGHKIWKNNDLITPYIKKKLERKGKIQSRKEMREKQAQREEIKQSIPKVIDPMEGIFKSIK